MIKKKKKKRLIELLQSTKAETYTEQRRENVNTRRGTIDCSSVGKRARSRKIQNYRVTHGRTGVLPTCQSPSRPDPAEPQCVRHDRNEITVPPPRR